MAPREGLRKMRLGRAALFAAGASVLLMFSVAVRTTDSIKEGLSFLWPVSFCLQRLPHLRDRHEAPALRRSARSSQFHGGGGGGDSLAVPFTAAGASLVAVGLLRAQGARARTGTLRRALEDEGKLGKATPARPTGPMSGQAEKVNEEKMSEGAVEELERKMLGSAEAGNFEEAAKHNKQLLSAQLDDEGSVLTANVKFYEAFNKRDLVSMKKCWYNVPFAQCIHPYEQDYHHHTGYTDICSSFERVFKQSKMETQMSFDQVKVNVRGGTAIVTCRERLLGKNYRINLRVSHIFRKSADDRWKMLHRHASKPPGDSPGLEADEESFQQFQKVMRAAQNLGLGGNSIVIRAPFFTPEHDGEDDGPFGIGGNMTPVPVEQVDDDLDAGSDSDSDLEEELYVDPEEDEVYDAREAIGGLRRLADEGVLTREEKVLLLAEMSDNPKENMAERAYALLLRDVSPEDAEAAWQDFADLLSLQVKRLDKSKSGRQRQAKEGAPDKS